VVLVLTCKEYILYENVVLVYLIILYCTDGQQRWYFTFAIGCVLDVVFNSSISASIILADSVVSCSILSILLSILMNLKTNTNKISIFECIKYTAF